MHRALAKSGAQRSLRAGDADYNTEAETLDPESKPASSTRRKESMRESAHKSAYNDREAENYTRGKTYADDSTYTADESYTDESSYAAEPSDADKLAYTREATPRRSRRSQGGSRKRGNVANEGVAERTTSARKSTPRNLKNRRQQSRDYRGLFVAIAVIVFVAVMAFALKAVIGAANRSKQAKLEAESMSIVESSIAESESESESIAEETGEDLEKAKLMYAQYDYDNAIELLKSLPNYDVNTEAQELVAKCEETKATLEEQDIYKITHVFFHILCVDPENSFDESKWGSQAGGYNSLMTTISEFEKMMQEMYDKGYVLVSLHDVAHEEEQADGSKKMVKGSIMLPPGKKAFVMSEDDVCYYEYMKGAGYADKMIIGDDGRPTLHYTDKDGNEFVGDYDLVPILDKFIDEHPDFSYKGHKACLVFTGYNGVLGYRTDESYDPNSEYYDPKLEQGHDIEAERKEAIEVMKALVADGYDLGSHSWGHRDLGTIEMDRFKKDCDRWNRNVAPLINEATGEQPDIIIFPKGADIGDWHPYAADNERFNYMYNLGFRYYCNVDNNQYWVQLGDKYLRQGRRALDGLNMWLQISGQNDRLSDLFDDVSAIFDPARPTPVPSY